MKEDLIKLIYKELDSLYQMESPNEDGVPQDWLLDIIYSRGSKEGSINTYLKIKEIIQNKY